MAMPLRDSLPQSRDYAGDSAEYIWGEALGDPVADEILRYLRQAPDGRTRTEIRDLFGRHRSADQIGSALAKLAAAGKVTSDTRETGGRSAEIWRAG